MVAGFCVQLGQNAHGSSPAPLRNAKWLIECAPWRRVIVSSLTAAILPASLFAHHAKFESLGSAFFFRYHFPAFGHHGASCSLQG